VDGALVRSDSVLPGGAMVRVDLHEGWAWRWWGETRWVDVAASHGSYQPVFSIDRPRTFSGGDYTSGLCALEQSNSANCIVHCVTFHYMPDMYFHFSTTASALG
jgi:hypothetical protein